MHVFLVIPIGISLEGSLTRYNFQGNIFKYQFSIMSAVQGLKVLGQMSDLAGINSTKVKFSPLTKSCCKMIYKTILREWHCQWLQRMTIESWVRKSGNSFEIPHRLVVWSYVLDRPFSIMSYTNFFRKVQIRVYYAKWRSL